MYRRRRFLKGVAATLGGICCASARMHGAEVEKEAGVKSEEGPDLGDLVARHFHKSGRS
jgi:hypothetical protein